MEKKTRHDEGTADIQSVVSGLKQTTAAARRQFVFDNINLPGMINYLAARALVQDLDDTRKNHYLYRDTRGTGEWTMFPWDKDWTFGEVGLGGTVVADRAAELATGNPNIAFSTQPKACAYMRAVLIARTAGLLMMRSIRSLRALNNFAMNGASRSPRAFNGRWKSSVSGSSQLLFAWRVRKRVRTWRSWRRR